MKQSYFFLIISLLASVSLTNAAVVHSFDWARSLPSNSNHLQSRSIKIQRLADGNILNLETLRGIRPPCNTSPYCQKETDITGTGNFVPAFYATDSSFIGSYTQNGNTNWTLKLSINNPLNTNAGVSIRDFATVGNELYIVGVFGSPTDFNPNGMPSIQQPTLYNPSIYDYNTDVLIARYNLSNGELIDFKQFPTRSAIQSSNVNLAFDSQARVILTGHYSASVNPYSNFVPTNFSVNGGTHLPPTNTRGFFIVRYNPANNWAIDGSKFIPAPEFSSTTSLAVGVDDRILVGGTFTGSGAQFTLGTYTSPVGGPDDYDGFIYTTNSGFNIENTYIFGSNEDDLVAALDLLEGNILHVGGAYSDDFDFDFSSSSSLGDRTINSRASFIASYKISRVSDPLNFRFVNTLSSQATTGSSSVTYAPFSTLQALKARRTACGIKVYAKGIFNGHGNFDPANSNNGYINLPNNNFQHPDHRNNTYLAVYKSEPTPLGQAPFEWVGVYEYAGSNWEANKSLALFIDPNTLTSSNITEVYTNAAFPYHHSAGNPLTLDSNPNLNGVSNHVFPLFTVGHSFFSRSTFKECEVVTAQDDALPEESVQVGINNQKIEFFLTVKPEEYEIIISDLRGAVIARQKFRSDELAQINLNVASQIYLVQLSTPQLGILKSKKIRLIQN